jgi:uroporphyrinogen-III synthase
MSLRVAITRAMPEAEATAVRVRERGATPYLAPLLSIVPCSFDVSLRGAQALLFTSANGVRAFPGARAAKALQVLTVGDATARAAHAAGFANVRSASGDAEALIALARALLAPSAGKLIHIAGQHVAGDVAGRLREAGFEVEQRTAYTAVAAATLPSAFAENLDLVLFHSARAAETYMAFGAPGSERFVAGCLSSGVAIAAAKAAWRRIVTAPVPNDEALLGATLGGEIPPTGASA